LQLQVRYLVPAVPGLAVLTAQVLQTGAAGVNRLLLALSIAYNWFTAATHQSIGAVAAHGLAEGFQLSWARRMFHLGLLSHPTAATIVVLLVSVGSAYLLLKREVTCAS
jgi:hypothetical protein